jgi:hypothetical protein
MVFNPVCKTCPAKMPILKIDSNVKRALAYRLKFFLEEEERHLEHFENHAARHLGKTRAEYVRRDYRQRIQALRVVIWMLTPPLERTTEFPGFWRR